MALIFMAMSSNLVK